MSRITESIINHIRHPFTVINRGVRGEKFKNRVIERAEVKAICVFSVYLGALASIGFAVSKRTLLNSAHKFKVIQQSMGVFCIVSVVSLYVFSAIGKYKIRRDNSPIKLYNGGFKVDKDQIAVDPDLAMRQLAHCVRTKVNSGCEVRNVNGQVVSGRGPTADLFSTVLNYVPHSRIVKCLKVGVLQRHLPQTKSGYGGMTRAEEKQWRDIGCVMEKVRSLNYYDAELTVNIGPLFDQGLYKALFCLDQIRVEKNIPKDSLTISNLQYLDKLKICANLFQNDKIIFPQLKSSGNVMSILENKYYPYKDAYSTMYTMEERYEFCVELYNIDKSKCKDPDSDASCYLDETHFCQYAATFQNETLKTEYLAWLQTKIKELKVSDLDSYIAPLLCINREILLSSDDNAESLERKIQGSVDKEEFKILLQFRVDKDAQHREVNNKEKKEQIDEASAQKIEDWFNKWVDEANPDDLADLLQIVTGARGVENYFWIAFGLGDDSIAACSKTAYICWHTEKLGVEDTYDSFKAYFDSWVRNPENKKFQDK